MVEKFEKIILNIDGVRSVIFPGTSQGNKVTESLCRVEGVRKIMEGHFEVGKKSREQDFRGNLEKAGQMRMKGYEDMVSERGVLVDKCM